MIHKVRFSLVFMSLFFAFAGTSNAQFLVDAEAGVVSTIYNHVRIPGNKGTFIALQNGQEATAKPYARLRLGYTINERSELLVLFAPLNFNYTGLASSELSFQGETFSESEQYNAFYKFNSYRITYRYMLLRNERLKLSLGGTLKVRDAIISMEGGGKYAAKKDLGAVPLAHFMLSWHLFSNLGLEFEGDALGVSLGRAADVALSLNWQLKENIRLNMGYRLLEGGADNAVVYTFSMFQYAFLGANFIL